MSESAAFFFFLQECFPLLALFRRKKAFLVCTRVMGQWWSGYFLMEPSNSWPLTVIKRYSIFYRGKGKGQCCKKWLLPKQMMQVAFIFYVATVCYVAIMNIFPCIVLLLVNPLNYVSSLLILVILSLQLLSKRIGISGHVHRLMAGSMAGNLSFKLIRLAFSQCQLEIT